MIVEGLITTVNEDGSPHLAAMGPVVDRDYSSFLLRPYISTTTYRNIARTGTAVFHVTDDARLVAFAAIGQVPNDIDYKPAATVDGHVLADCCRYFELSMTNIDDSRERTEIRCDVKHSESVRDFWGFCRAHHALLEAAIYATRIDFLSHNLIHSELQKFKVIVAKTGGESELQAMDELWEFVIPQLQMEEDARSS